MKKLCKLFVLVLALILIIVFWYLYINKLFIFDEFRNVSISPSEVLNRLNEYENVASSYMLSENEIKERYSIDDMSIISNCSVLTSFMNLEAFEIGIFKMSDKKYMEDFKLKLLKRADDVIKYYDGYIYESAEIAKDYTIKQYNDTLILIIHKNKDEIIKYIEKIILESN